MTQIAFEKKCDVLVCGAGIAGVAAALEGARAGLDTILLEKTIFPGGLATTGLVNIYLPLCDGNGRQVSFGLAEELLRLSLVYGPGTVPEGWRGLRQGAEPLRYRVVFSPASYVLALDEVLQQAGVRSCFDTLACVPILDGRRVTGVEVENKSGRGRIRAGCVVDATGDADITFRAGVPCVQGPNRLSIWAWEQCADDVRSGEPGNKAKGGLGWARLDGPADDTSYRGTDGDDVSAFVLAGRRLLRERYKARFDADPERREREYPVALPAMAQYRTTRRIEGQATLRPGQDWERRPDSVGLAADWRRPGSVWEIPYGTLVPLERDNLLAAGRCMASADDAWQVTRVIPAAAVTGQACGAAAALAVRQGVAPATVAAADLQRVLAAKDIPLHLDEIYTPEEQAAYRARE